LKESDKFEPPRKGLLTGWQILQPNYSIMPSHRQSLAYRDRKKIRNIVADLKVLKIPLPGTESSAFIGLSVYTVLGI